jgi:alkylation response protein AidB-like acyl-CoA dehydrogenase
VSTGSTGSTNSTDVLGADTADRKALRDVTRAYLARTANWSANQHVAAIEAGFDRAGWREMATDIGLLGVRIEERFGGSGLGLAEELLVHEELGRALYNGPYLSTIGQVAPMLSVLTDDPANVERLSAIASGELIVAAALPIEETFPLTYPDVLRNGQGEDDLRLTGRLPAVIDAQIADALVVLANFEGFHAYFWVQSDAPGVQITPLETVDLTRRIGCVEFSDVRVQLMAEQDRARAGVAAMRAGGALALAAESVGLARRALEMTVEYVKIRSQFGQVLGAFQAIKHLCAEMLVQLEGATSALLFAQSSVEQGDPIAAKAALAVARTHCGRIAFFITNEAVHLHGGIGYTWEHPVHLYYRRAKSNQLLLDSTGAQSRILTAAVTELYRRKEAIA